MSTAQHRLVLSPELAGTLMTPEEFDSADGCDELFTGLSTVSTGPSPCFDNSRSPRRRWLCAMEKFIRRHFCRDSNCLCRSCGRKPTGWSRRKRMRSLAEERDRSMFSANVFCAKMGQLAEKRTSPKPWTCGARHVGKRLAARGCTNFGNAGRLNRVWGAIARSRVGLPGQATDARGGRSRSTRSGPGGSTHPRAVGA